MKYNFDEVVDRRGTNAMSVHGYRDYLFGDREEVDIPYADEELISMWVADMEFRTAEPILEALHRHVDHGVFGYTMSFDHGARDAFVEWVRERHGHTFTGEHIVESKGIIAALKFFAGLCGTDERILVLTPSYAFFKHAATYHGLDVVCSDMILRDGQYYIDYDDLRAKASDPRVTMTFLCSPHNPTGRIWTDDELREYAQICLDHDVMIVSDEIHCDLTRTDRSFTPLASLFPESNRIMTCMAPSKTFNMAGMKSAYVVIPDDRIRQLWQERHSPMQISLSMTATEAAYQHGGEWLDQLRAYLDESFVFLEKYLSEHLPLAKYRISEATYLAWVDLSAYELPEEATYFFAREAGVLLEGGKMFVANADGYVRLNLACPRARLREGLDRMVQAIQTL